MTRAFCCMLINQWLAFFVRFFSSLFSSNCSLRTKFKAPDQVMISNFPEPDAMLMNLGLRE